MKNINIENIVNGYISQANCLKNKGDKRVLDGMKQKNNYEISCKDVKCIFYNNDICDFYNHLDYDINNYK